ncbi:MAG: hypothetical protein JW922_10570 [Paludibacteraceae bacterium]|nr:hypothetical protein [Paludibacteraceae bacterium]
MKNKNISTIAISILVVACFLLTLNIFNQKSKISKLENQSSQIQDSLKIRNLEIVKLKQELNETQSKIKKYSEAKTSNNYSGGLTGYEIDF